MAESWTPLLEAGDPEAGWDRFIERYGRLILGVIYFHSVEHDEVMDRFTGACKALGKKDSARLRRSAAKFSEPDDRVTWQLWAARGVDLGPRPVLATIRVST